MTGELPKFEDIPGFLTIFSETDLRLALAIASAIKQMGGISGGGGGGGGGDASAFLQTQQLSQLVAIRDRLPTTLLGGKLAVETGEVEIRNEQGNPLSIQGSVNADNMPSIFPVTSNNLTQSGSANTSNVNLYTGDMTGVNCISFQLLGTWVGTVQLQFSNNNSDWVAINSINVVTRSPNNLNITSNGLFASESFGMFCRLRVTSYTSGTIEARLSLNTFPASYALPSSGGSGGGDASALKQDEQTVELLGIKARMPSSGVAADGSDATGVAPLAGASGIRGWLSGIYATLAARLPTLISDRLPVNVLFPTSQAVHNVNAFGENLTATANNVNIWAGEFGSYTAISFQLVGTWVATVQIQFSNDNANWIAGNAINISNLNYTGANLTGNGVYACLSFGRYWRLRTTTYTSGTINASFVLMSLPPSFYSNNLAVDVLKLANNAALSDTINRTLNTTTVGAAHLLDDGTNLTRARSFGGTGEGLGRAKVANGTGPLTMLNAASAPVTGTAIDLRCAYDRFSYQTIVASGSVTSATIVIDGSLNGTDWGELYTLSFTGTSGSVFTPTPQRPAIHVRARLTAIAGGGSLTLLGCGIG